MERLRELLLAALFDDLARERWQTRWRSYLVASLLSGLTLGVALLLLGGEGQVIVASLGATAFIVLAMPKSRAARTSSAIGGQAIGLLCGGLASLVPHEPLLLASVVNGLAVAVCALAMLATRYKHPPAAGTALGVSVLGISLDTFLTVMGVTVIISAIRIITLTVAPDFSADQ